MPLADENTSLRLPEFFHVVEMLLKTALKTRTDGIIDYEAELKYLS